MKKIFLIIILVVFNSCTIQKFINKKKTVPEFKFIKEQIYTYHPNPNYFILKSYTDSIYNLIFSELLNNKRLSIYEYESIVSSYVSSFNDGHMQIIPNTSMEINNILFKWCFPFKVSIQNDTSLIVKDIYKNNGVSINDTITYINGKSVKSILNKLYNLLPYSNKRFKRLIISSEFSEKLINIGLNSPYKIRITGKKFDVLVRGVKLSRYIKLKYNKTVRIYKKYFQTKNGIIILPEDWGLKNTRIPNYYFYLRDSVAYLRIKKFAGNEKQKLFYKNCFDLIFKNKVDIMIIDLRNNMGGRTKNINYLLKFLSTKKIQIADRVIVKLNRKNYTDYFDFLQKKDSSKYLINKNLKIGDTLTLFSKNELFLPQKQNDKNVYKGKIFVLVNYATFSTANYFATIIKKNKLGKIVGTKTGGYTNSFGDPINIKLPFSKLYLNIPTKQILQQDYFIKKTLMPDMEINILFKKNIESNLINIIQTIKNEKNENF